MRKFICFFSLAMIAWATGWAADQKAVGQTAVIGEKCDAPVWVVGDSWKWQTSEKKFRETKVVGVDETSYIVESPYDVDKYCYDKKNLQYVAYINSEGKKVQETYPSSQHIAFPLFVGKKWSWWAPGRPEGGGLLSRNYHHEYFVMAYENVTVPAGVFKAYKIQYTQTNQSFHSGKVYRWYSPEVKNYVKLELDKWSMDFWGGSNSWKDEELVSFKSNTTYKQSTPATKKAESTEKSQALQVPQVSMAPQAPQAPQKPQAAQGLRPPTVSPKGSFGTVSSTYANIRSGAGDAFSIVSTVKKGDKLVLLGEFGDWLNVRLESGQEGWISSKWVQK